MQKLKDDLNDLNTDIEDLKIRIQKAREEAENNIAPLNIELEQVKRDKTRYASKGDFDSIQSCRRREDNLKFKINAQWNTYSMLRDDLTRLKKQRTELENQIRLEKDRLKRKEEIISQMDEVLACYRKTRNLDTAAVKSNINPSYVHQWFEWGKNNFNETYSYFYSEVLEIDEYFRKLDAKKQKKEMDRVIEAYKKTKSLRKASEIAGVGYDSVMYWQKWGSLGFGEENIYFFKKLNES